MRDLPWQARFGGAHGFGNRFGYPDDEGNKALVRSMVTAAKIGGKLVLETPMVALSALLSVKAGFSDRVGASTLFLIATRET